MRDILTVNKAQELFSLGFSVAEISRKLKKSSSNVSRWCRKTQETKIVKPANYQEKRRQLWYNYEKVKITNLNTKTCKTLLSVLYWCEGAKYPSSGEVAFTSSDGEMQKVFVTLLRKAYSKEIDEKKFRVVLQIPASYDIEDSKKYWSKLLKIPIDQFYKPYITKTQGNRFRSSYKGTCGLRYHDYRILLRIMGAYNQIAKQIIGEVA